MDLEYTSLNEVLVKLFNDIMEEEGKAIISGEFKDLTNNDMHVIEAIGLSEEKNMSAIASRLGITVGSLTTAMNSLVNKKYVERFRSEKDRRVVYVKLTESGVRAFQHHAEYHHQMTEAILKRLAPEELPVLMKLLESLNEFFKERKRNE